MQKQINLIIILLIFMMGGCAKNEKEKEKTEIILAVVDRLAVPRPSVFYKKTLEENKKLKDTLTLNISISNTLTPINESIIVNSNVPKDYKILITKLGELSDTLKIEFPKTLISLKGHRIFDLESRKKNVDNNFYFSRIAFGEENQKALVYVILDLGKLNRTSYLICLLKRNGIWNVTDKIILSYS